MNRSRELAEILLQKARDDAWMLHHLLADPDAPVWGLGFHAQQAVEKAIKAVLTAHSVEYPRTHNLSLLLDLLEATGVPPPRGAAELPALTPFGALLRYDDDPQARQAEAEVRRPVLRLCVERTLAWAETILSPEQRQRP
jgi:HEPN domain-containing protein